MGVIVRLSDVGGDVFEQVVVALHLLAVRGFSVKPVAKAHDGFCLAGGGLFKEFEGLADAGAAVTDGSVVFDVDEGKGMNGACSALAGIWRKRKITPGSAPFAGFGGAEGVVSSSALFFPSIGGVEQGSSPL